MCESRRTLRARSAAEVLAFALHPVAQIHINIEVEAAGSLSLSIQRWMGLTWTLSLLTFYLNMSLLRVMGSCFPPPFWRGFPASLYIAFFTQLLFIPALAKGDPVVSPLS